MYLTTCDSRYLRRSSAAGILSVDGIIIETPPYHSCLSRLKALPAGPANKNNYCRHNNNDSYIHYLSLESRETLGKISHLLWLRLKRRIFFCAKGSQKENPERPLDKTHNTC